MNNDMDVLPVDDSAGGDMSAVVQAITDAQAAITQSLTQLDTNIVSLHNSLFFAVGLIAGIAFAVQLLKGWLDA